MSELSTALQNLTRILRQETLQLRSAPLSDIAQSMEAKKTAISLLASITEVPGETHQPLIRDLLAAADENRIAAATIDASLTALAQHLQQELRSAADAGTYGPKGRGQGRVLAGAYDASA